MLSFAGWMISGGEYHTCLGERCFVSHTYTAIKSFPPPPSPERTVTSLFWVCQYRWERVCFSLSLSSFFTFLFWVWRVGEYELKRHLSIKRNFWSGVIALSWMDRKGGGCWEKDTERGDQWIGGEKVFVDSYSFFHRSHSSYQKNSFSPWSWW